jgi:hypothetical protein
MSLLNQSFRALVADLENEELYMDFWMQRLARRRNQPSTATISHLLHYN